MCVCVHMGKERGRRRCIGTKRAWIGIPKSIDSTDRLTAPCDQPDCADAESPNPWTKMIGIGLWFDARVALLVGAVEAAHG